MIPFADIKKLGFSKVRENDSVYEAQYGRPYWYMEFKAVVQCMGYANEIVFNWDCDTLNVNVFKNENEHIATFSEFEDFIKFFTVFERE